MLIPVKFICNKVIPLDCLVLVLNHCVSFLSFHNFPFRKRDAYSLVIMNQTNKLEKSFFKEDLIYVASSYK